MYQFRIRLGIGRRLPAQQPKQPTRNSRIDQNAIDSTVSFRQLFLSASSRAPIIALTIATGCLIPLLSGCGATYVPNSAASGSGGTSQSAQLSAISCATQSLTGAQSTVCSVSLAAAATSSTTVSMTSSNAALNVPATVVVQKGSSTAGFNAISSAVSQSVTVTITGATGGVTKTDLITLYPNSENPGSLSQLSCGSSSFTGAGTTTCTLGLSSAAPTGGLSVSVSSNNGSVTVPTSVMVPSGASTSSFTAGVAAVSASQKATVTASAENSTRSFAMELNAVGPQVSLSTTSLDFGNVSLGTAATKSVTVTSSGSVPVKINSDSISGTGFSVSGGNLPTTLNPGHAAVLTVRFDPTETSPATGELRISSNVSTPSIALSGAGTEASSPVLSSISCGTQSLTGVQSRACSVYLGAAATNSTTVSLTSSNVALKVPATVVVQKGATAAGFSAVSSEVSKSVAVTITGTAGGVTKTDVITLEPSQPSEPAATLSAISCGTQTITGATTKACSVSLSAAASSPISVSLTSSNAALKVPSTVVVAAGASTTGFNAVSSAVSKSTTVTITGDGGGVTKTDVITLDPSQPSQPAVTLSTITCGTQSLTGAQSKACSVSLSGTAVSPTTVSLTSSNAALQVPASVVVASGASTTGFNAVSSTVSKSTSVTITGNADGVTKTDVITLYPGPVAVATLSRLSCGTQTLTGPTTEACSVYLSAAATSQTVVTLASSSSSVTVPASVTVATGASSAGFSVAASAVSTTQSVTLTARAGGISQTAVLQLDGTSPASPQHEVKLNWIAPNTTLLLAGYNVYRSTAGASSYQLLNSSVDVNTNYIDTAVQSGQTYDYVVRTVDILGIESAPSNMTSVTVP